MKERLAINAVSGLGLQAARVVVIFLLTPIIVGALGNRDYGVWEVILVLVGYFSLVDMGLGPALVRFFSYEAARNEPGTIQRGFVTAIVALTASGLFCLAGLALLGLAPHYFVGLDPGDIPNLGLVFVLVGMNLVIKLPGTVLSAHLLANQRHWISYLIRVAVLIGRAIATAYVLTQTDYPGLVALATIELAASFIEYAIFALVLMRTEPNLRLRRRDFSLDTLRELYRFGAKSLLGLVSRQLLMQAMPLVIAQVVGVERVVFFLLAKRLAEQASEIGVMVSRPLNPYWSSLYGQDDMSKLQNDWFTTSRLLQFLYCGMAVGIAFVGPGFITAWMGPEYGDECRPIVILTSLVLLFEGLAPNAFHVLTGMDRHGRAGLVLLVAAVVGIVCAALLGGRYDLIGVTVAYTVACAASAIGVMILACWEIEISTWEHLKKTIARLALPMLIEAACLYAIAHYAGAPDTYLEIAAHALIAGLAFTLSWWILTLSAHERALLLGLARRTESR